MSLPLPCSKSFLTYYASNMSVTANANCYLRKGLLNGSIDSLLVASEDCQVSNCKTLLTEIFIYTAIDCTFVEAQTGNQWRFSKLKDFCDIPLAPGTAPPSTTALSKPTTAPPSTIEVTPATPTTTTTTSPSTTPATTETTAPTSSTGTARPPAPSAASTSFNSLASALKLAVVVVVLYSC